MKLGIAKLNSKGQVVIPKDVRKELGIKEGEKFLVLGNGDSIVLRKFNELGDIKDIDINLLNNLEKKKKRKNV